MLKEVIQTGRSVDTAIEEACKSLGRQREDCEFEIIDLPKKTLFGLKTIPAKVRVWVEVPDEKPVKAASTLKPQVQETRRQPPQIRETQIREARPQQKRESRFPARKDPRPLVNEKQEKVTGVLTEKEKLAKEYIAGILGAMKLESEIEIYREESGICIKLGGAEKSKELGVIIGHRGETLDAIQYLTGLVVNRLEGDYMRITIDCGDYRVKRQDTLKDLAIRIADQVKSTDISRTLEPMNPFERRIIHSTVSEIEGVNSISVGEEPNRRVVITTPTAKRPTPRGGREGSRSSDRERTGTGTGGYRGGRSGGSGDYERGERSNYRNDRRDRDGSRGSRSAPSRGGRDSGSRGPKPPPQIAPDVPKATPEAGFGGEKFGKIEL